MNFLNKLSAAVIGELLFRLIYLLEHVVLLPTQIFWAWQKLFQWMGLDREHLIGKILAGSWTALSCLLILAIWIVSPFALLGAVLGLAIINYSIDYKWQAAFIGWNQGFDGLFIHCAERYNYVLDLSVDAPHLVNLTPILNNIEIQQHFPAEYLAQIAAIAGMGRRTIAPGEWFILQDFLTQVDELINQQRQPAAPAIGQDNIIDLDTITLSSTELDRFRADQNPPLSKEELTRLQSETDGSIKNKLTNYIDLLERLEDSGNCIILGERPEKQQAVLLVKLYQRDGQEFPVPMSSHIFDRQALRRWVNGHNNNPAMGRDPIFGSQYYQGCPTRYVVHAYYPTSESTTGVSQELGELAGSLRAHLEQNQPRVSERNRIIAERLSYFFPASSSFSSDNQPAVANTSRAQSPSI